MSDRDEVIAGLDATVGRLEACATALEAAGQDASTLREEAAAAEAISTTLWWGGGR